MPFLLRNICLEPGTRESVLPDILCRRLQLKPAELLSWVVVRKGVDARRKRQVRFVYTVEFSVADEALFAGRSSDPDLVAVKPPSPETPFPACRSERRIVIVGMGPAGLFTALRLAEYGMTATLLERGRPIDERLRDVQSYWSRGMLDPQSNVQFGEGGAGTFSDGKLTTRVKDANIAYVLEKLVQFGAPPEIRYLAKPHIGTDRLRDTVKRLRGYLQDRGCTVRFASRLTDIAVHGDRVRGVVVNASEEIPCDLLVLAPGHSARDTYRMLHDRGVQMTAKPFAIGLRVEHPQELINRIQYGVPNDPHLPPADYALAYNDARSGRSAYSFCMCPGGVVVASASEPDGVVTNGMSNHQRNAPYANSALVTTVTPADFGGCGPLAGIDFQRRWERAAYLAGGESGRAPAQNLLAFLGQGRGAVVSSYRPGVVEAELDSVLPPYVTATLRDGIRYFDRKMKGFVTAEATLTGVETRTSAPVRIVRGDDFQSVTLRGLYPAGEGAGYAGGIMSAALDGIRVADRIARELQHQGESA